MAVMTVVYRTPKNKEAFDEHYFKVHVPLAQKLPGLRKYEVSKAPILSPTGHADTYMVANLYFDTLEDMKKAFATEEGKACAADRKILAPDNADVQIYLYDTTSV
jgi:uncharacterized protein (TIGR02118 family)